MMPTGGKIVGAVTFAMLAYFVSDLVKPLLPEGTQYGLLSIVNAGFGFILGWRIIGRRSGQTYPHSFGYGVTTVVAIAFWCLLFWSGLDMLTESTRMRFDGPVEALQEMAGTFLDQAKMLATETVVLPAVIGALFMAWVTEFVSRRFS